MKVWHSKLKDSNFRNYSHNFPVAALLQAVLLAALLPVGWQWPSAPECGIRLCGLCHQPLTASDPVKRNCTRSNFRWLMILDHVAKLFVRLFPCLRVKEGARHKLTRNQGSNIRPWGLCRDLPGIAYVCICSPVCCCRPV